MRNGIVANNMLPKMRLSCMKARRWFLERSKLFSCNTVTLDYCIPGSWLETFHQIPSNPAKAANATEHVEPSRAWHPCSSQQWESNLRAYNHPISHACVQTLTHLKGSKEQAPEQAKGFTDKNSRTLPPPNLISTASLEIQHFPKLCPWHSCKHWVHCMPKGWQQAHQI